jgi:hypothetical protein
MAGHHRLFLWTEVASCTFLPKHPSRLLHKMLVIRELPVARQSLDPQFLEAISTSQIFGSILALHANEEAGVLPLRPQARLQPK